MPTPLKNGLPNDGLAKYVLAGDIGGTNMRAALADREGSLLARAVCATQPENGLRDAERRLVGLFEEVRSGVPFADVGGIVLSSAGPIVPATGIYDHPPNLPGWHGQTMKPRLAESLDLPVSIGHDATLGALAESRYGVGKGSRTLVYVTVSTGVGAGVVLNGVLLHSRSSLAEVGWTTIDVHGGGTVETLGAGPALQRATGMAPAEVVARVEAGDADAVRAFASMTTALAVGIANLVFLFMPERVVIGPQHPALEIRRCHGHRGRRGPLARLERRRAPCAIWPGKSVRSADEVRGVALPAGVVHEVERGTVPVCAVSCPTVRCPDDIGRGFGTWGQFDGEIDGRIFFPFEGFVIDFVIVGRRRHRNRPYPLF